MGLTQVKNDTFTEASDTPLGSHTADQGGGWTVSDGTLTVIAASDRLQSPDVSGTLRRAYMSDLAVNEMDVACALYLAWVSGHVHGGPRARLTTSTNDGYAAVFDRRDPPRWFIAEGVDSASFNEAYPGDGTEMVLQIRTARKSVVVGGVEKVALTSDNHAGQKTAGLWLGRTTSDASNVAELDNFKAWELLPDLIPDYRTFPIQKLAERAAGIS